MCVCEGGEGSRMKNCRLTQDEETNKKLSVPILLLPPSSSFPRFSIQFAKVALLSFSRALHSPPFCCLLSFVSYDDIYWMRRQKERKKVGKTKVVQ